MALTVETGAGLEDADAFISLIDCDDYHSTLGNAEWTGTDAAKEAAIRRATIYISTAFKYTGVRTNGRGQALAWPRENVVDIEGNEIDSDEIPYEVADATCEAALFELRTPNGLNVTLTDSRIKRDKVGDVETEFFSGQSGADALRPTLTRLEDLLANLLAKKGRSAETIFLERA